MWILKGIFLEWNRVKAKLSNLTTGKFVIFLGMCLKFSFHIVTNSSESQANGIFLFCDFKKLSQAIYVILPPFYSFMCFIQYNGLSLRLSCYNTNRRYSFWKIHICFIRHFVENDVFIRIIVFAVSRKYFFL